MESVKSYKKVNIQKRYQESFLSYFLMYLFCYIALAVFSGYISIYLMDLGYNASQIAFVVSCSFILSMIIQPFIGILNDKYHDTINEILLIIAGILGIVFIYLKDIILIGLIYGLVLAIINGIMPMLEKKATISSHPYVSIRIWATIGYAVGSLIGGMIYHHVSPTAMYILYVIAIFISVIGIYGTKDIPNVRTTQKKSMIKVFLNKQVLLYFVIACIFYGTTNVNTTYLPAMFQSIGISMDLVSTIILILTLFELPVIALYRYINKIRNKTLLIIDFIIIIIQFMIYTLVSNTIIIIITACLTKAVATMIFIMLNMKIVAILVDKQHQMTALALVSTIKSFASIIFQFAAGYFVDYYSYQILYAILTVVAVIGLIIILFYQIDDHQEDLFQ